MDKRALLKSIRMRDECATRPAESLAEGRRAEPPEAWYSYPEDDRRQLTWVIATGLVAVLVAGAVDAVRSSEPGSSPSRMVTTERSAARETTIPVETTPVALPRCTV